MAFENFLAEVGLIKRSRNLPKSRLYPLLCAIEQYNNGPSKWCLQIIEMELNKARRIKKFGIQNIVKKYGSAFSILELEIDGQRRIFEQEERRALSKIHLWTRKKDKPWQATKGPKRKPTPDARRFSRTGSSSRRPSSDMQAPPPPPPAPPFPSPAGPRVDDISNKVSKLIVDKNTNIRDVKILDKLVYGELQGKEIPQGMMCDDRHIGKDKPWTFAECVTSAWAFERTGATEIQDSLKANYSKLQSNNVIYLMGHGHAASPDHINAVATQMTTGDARIRPSVRNLYIVYTRCRAGLPFEEEGDDQVTLLSKALADRNMKNIYVIGAMNYTSKSPATGDYIFVRKGREGDGRGATLTNLREAIKKYDALSGVYLSGFLNELARREPHPFYRILLAAMISPMYYICVIYQGAQHDIYYMFLEPEAFRICIGGQEVRAKQMKEDILEQAFKGRVVIDLMSLLDDIRFQNPQSNEVWKNLESLYQRASELIEAKLRR